MNEKNDWIWWVVIIALLVSITPLGLIGLFIYLNRNKNKTKQIPEKSGQTSYTAYTFNEAMDAASSAVNTAMRSVSEAINSTLGEKPQAKPAASKISYQMAKKPPKPKKPLSRAAARLKIISGCILAGSFSIGAIATFFDELGSVLHGLDGLIDMLEELIPLGIFACLSGILALWGYYGLQKCKRFDRYQGLIQPARSTLSVRALADALELKYSRVCDDLDEMIDRGYFEFAYLDRAKGQLILSPDYVVLYDTEPAPKAAPQPKAESDSVQDISEEDQLLLRIRRANDLISNQEMSQKLDEIEQLTRKIFKLLEERPEKAEDLHSFTNYYLPQTLKITEAYARLEAQGIEGENISDAKAKITSALDKLAEGYRQQLDQLFADDVVDITADIAVMEHMLARDGLAGDELQPEKRS